MDTVSKKFSNCLGYITVSSFILFRLITISRANINFILLPPDAGEGTAYASYNSRNNKYEICFFRNFVDQLSNHQLIFVIVHEFMHVILNHIPRTLKHHKQAIMNLACDHYINRSIIDDISNHAFRSDNDNLVKIEAPTGDFKPFIIPPLLKDSKIISEEAIYDWLMKNAEVSQESFELQPGNEKSKVKLEKVKITIDGETIEVITDIDGNIELNGDFFEKQEKTQRDIMNGLKIVSRNYNKGNTSSKCVSVLADLIDAKLPWNVILEDLVFNSAKVKNNDPNYKRPSKKSLAINHTLYDDVFLPDSERDPMVNKLVNVLDVSGSMPDEDLRKFLYIVQSSSYLFSEIQFIQHDTEVVNDEIFQAVEIQDNEDYITRLYGRGGTSHLDVFNLLEEQKSTDTDLIIFMTDYCSNINELWHKYTFHNMSRCVFIVNGKKIDDELPGVKYLYI